MIVGLHDRVSRLFSTAGLGLTLVGVGACGRVEYAPLDAAVPWLDAAGLDAAGLDAAGLDARADDAGGVDAGSVDAGDLDASVDGGGPDASIDGGPPCRARVSWVDGPGSDSLWRIDRGPGRAAFLHVELSTVTSAPGWPSGRGTLRVDDGVPGWFRPNDPTDLYFDGADLWVATRTGLERLDPDTGALRDTLGPLTGAGYVMVASNGAGQLLAAVDCDGGAGASWDGTSVPCGDSDLAFFALEATGTVRGAHLGAGPGSDDLGDALGIGSEFVLSVGAQMSPFCVDGSVCSGAGGPTRVLLVDAADGTPRGFTDVLGHPFISLARDADGNLYGGGADLASAPPGAGSRRWLSDGPSFPRTAIDPVRPRVYYVGRLVRPTVIGGVTVSPLGSESIAVVGLDRDTGALVEQHVFGDVGPYSLNGITVDDRGRITVYGDTRDPFVVCPGEAPPVITAQAAFLLTIDP